MSLRHVTRATLADKVARELERMIVSGEWAEGTRIPPEPELVERLGVSRNTLREAIRALSHVGLLEARPGDGTYVRSTSVLGASIARRLEQCDLRETLEARHCLEREAARLAALRRTPEDLARLREGFEATKRAFREGRPVETVVELVFDQRQAIVRAARNPLLEEIYESVSGSVRASIEAVLRAFDDVQADLESAERLHDELVEAIAAGDADRAADLVTENTELILSWVRQGSA